MSNLQAMRSNVFLRMSLSDGEIFAGSEVDRMLQREYEHVQTEVNMKNDEYFAKQVTFQTSGTGAPASITPYSFPIDFVKMVSLEIRKTGDRFEPVPYVTTHNREAYRNRRSWLYNEFLVYYYIIGDNFFLVPDQAPPGGSEDNMRMIYVFEPAELITDNDVPAFPNYYHEVLEIGAVNRLRKALKEPPIDVDEYNQKLLQMTETIAPRVKHNPKGVRMVSGGTY